MAQDHPRIRGEKVCPITLKEANAGSPPHTRGKADSIYGKSQAPRITPAYAGKRELRTGHAVATEDHPRIRGEKDLVIIFKALSQGSPPHTRGKVSLLLTFREDMRITPAYAGKSFRESWRWRRARDHPRIRGEKGRNA